MKFSTLILASITLSACMAQTKLITPVIIPPNAAHTQGGMLELYDPGEVNLTSIQNTANGVIWNGKSAANGNIVLQPGNVAGGNLAGVYVLSPRSDSPAFVVADNYGTFDVVNITDRSISSDAANVPANIIWALAQTSNYGLLRLSDASGANGFDTHGAQIYCQGSQAQCSMNSLIISAVPGATGPPFNAAGYIKVDGLAQGHDAVVCANAIGVLKDTGCTAASAPCGTDSMIQFNDGGNCGAVANFEYIKSSSELLLNNSVGHGIAINGAASGNNLLLAINDTAGTAGIDFYNNGTLTGTVSSGSTSAFSVQNNALTFIVTALQNGDVGIDTTSPGQPLTVKGATVGTTYIVGINDTTGSPGINFYSSGSLTGAISSGASAAFSVQNSVPSFLMTVLQGGDVGIGTTSPNNLLTLKGASVSSTALLLGINDTGGAEGISFYNNGTLTGQLSSGNTAALSIQNSVPNFVVTVLQNGDVGIGTTGPTHLLEVNGSAQVTSFLVTGLGGAGNRTACINNSGALYTVASGATC